MKRILLSLLLIGIVAGFAGVSRAGLTYRLLDVPTSNDTTPFGIDGTNIVGFFDGGPLSFLYDGAKFTYFLEGGTGPGFTYAHGISGNKIVGLVESQQDHAFLYDGVTFTNFDFPGTPFNTITSANGIDGNRIVGSYGPASDGPFHGFLYEGATFTTFDVPGAVSTEANGVNGNNIVGTYTDAGSISHGFLYDGATFTTLDVPGAVSTEANGVNGNNIVGTYTDAGSISHGFLYDGAAFTTLDLPGAINTYARGISGSAIVGWCEIPEFDNGQEYAVTHGFVAAPEPFPSTPVLDNFNRPDNHGPPSANWTDVYHRLRVLSGQAIGTAPGDENVAIWTASAFGPDFEVYTTITALPATGEEVVLYLRFLIAGMSGYQVGLLMGTGIQVFRVDKNVRTQLGSNIQVSPQPGDRLGARMVGDTLTVWYAQQGGGWLNLATITDSAHTGRGRVGASIRGTTGAIDDFGGGTHWQPFPSTAILDRFQRADNQGPPGSGWTNVHNGLKVSNTQAVGITSGGENMAAWTASAFGPDSEVYATIATLPEIGEEIFIYLRLQSSGMSGYRVGLLMGAGIQVFRIDNYSRIRLRGNIKVSPQAGDKLGARMVGDTLTVWYNAQGGGWVNVATITDGVHAGAGNIGLGIDGITGAIGDFNGGTYWKPFPSTPVLDNFNRPDNHGPPSANWTDVYHRLRVLSGQAIGTAPGDENVAIWTASAFGPDFEVYTTITALPATGEEVVLYLRFLIAGMSGYQVGLLMGTGIQVFRVDKNVRTQLGSNIQVSPQPGDRLGARMVGDTLTVWYAQQGGGWLNLATITDSAHTGRGRVGASIRGTTGAIDDFGGGRY